MTVYVRPGFDVQEALVAGAVVSIHPANASEFLVRYGYVSVQILDNRFDLLLSPAGVPFPLRVGESISISIKRQDTQIVLDARGAVLLARITWARQRRCSRYWVDGRLTVLVSADFDDRALARLLDAVLGGR